MGYILGKAEGKKHLWHGHVTAVTVAAEYRRLGCAKTLMNFLEQSTEQTYNGFFVDLFVRKSNAVAQTMYTGMGYTIYREVIGYYGEENAYDMRKAMVRDTKKKSVVPMTRAITPDELEW
jgi:N-terminal acetyltransferase B complex catalytic subunit